ncbi:hypothetical protein GGS23DRAFT_544393 [Durotheca rogersii]|uniref:uncharacterized protein n=1 Tax=Durotheca rogersii TaxID=419775 RepID=UPI00221FFE8C|nr:uncharacterized protein GGS23DRAFT_544393 [Durotheca rogersii]KAI5868174.1 hypothetical protein GGS23DRAFT_544393 [Durotheca rogersii]
MEAPLRWLAEGYLLLYALGFLPFPASSSKPRKRPSQYSRRRQLLLVRDCGVFPTFTDESVLAFQPIDPSLGLGGICVLGDPPLLVARPK